MEDRPELFEVRSFLKHVSKSIEHYKKYFGTKGGKVVQNAKR